MYTKGAHTQIHISLCMFCFFCFDGQTIVTIIIASYSVSCLTKYVVPNMQYNVYKIHLIQKSVKINILIQKLFSSYRFYSLGNFDVVWYNTPSTLLLFKIYLSVFVAIWKILPMYSVRDNLLIFVG